MPMVSDVASPPTRHRHLIDGAWREGEWIERTSPHDRRTVTALVASGTASDVDAAMAAARRAFPGWSETPAFDRAAVLSRAAGILGDRAAEAARVIHDQEGKTPAEAAAEVQRAVDYLDYFAAEVRRDEGHVLASEDPRQTVMTWRVPLGVVGLITPWNFPLAIPAWKLAPALASGNTVVIKPASEAPGAVTLLAEALMEAGLPRGVLNVVNGSGTVVGGALVAHPELDAISFTGSNRVGSSIADRLRGRHVRLQLELGGVNACVVLDDADPDAAAALIARAAFGQTGQACTATRQILCSPGMAVRLEQALGRITDGLTGRDVLGPLVGEHAEREVAAAVAAAIAAGAVPARPAHPGGARPTVLTGVTSDMAVARQEVFGPVLSIIEVSGLDEAIDLINAGDYGLTAGIITDSLSAAMSFARRVHVGTVKINRATTGNQPNVPFGGVKASSNGMYREQGSEALTFFTRTKSVYLGW